VIAVSRLCAQPAKPLLLQVFRIVLTTAACRDKRQSTTWNNGLDGAIADARDTSPGSAWGALRRLVHGDELLFGPPGGAVAELNLDLPGIGQGRQIPLRGGPRDADLRGQLNR
jgi:hypothetical protein